MMWNPFAWPSAVLITGIPPGECHDRLKANVRSGWSFDPSQGVTGMVGHRWFRLRQVILYRNSFQAVAAGTLEESGIGTRIRCAFRMNLLVQAFMVFWCIAGVWVSASLVPMGIHQMRYGAPPGDTPALGVIAPFLIFGFAAGLLAFGRWTARDERAFLIDFLRTTLDAQVDL
ncbi:MAG TPA: hypothetical protein VG387_12775 [Rhizomicrobium sp.]|jgi:hypothetical protein|nr:hypothetical protein [Rhizomicrobium sp.]